MRMRHRTFTDRIIGRYAAEDIINPKTGEIIVKVDEMTIAIGPKK